MLNRVLSSWWLVPVVSTAAYIAYAFYWPLGEDGQQQVAPEKPGTSQTAALPLNATFTTAGRIKFEDLTLSFSYPSIWEYGELHSDQVDATVRVIRPGTNPVHAGITLLVTRSPTALHAPKPLLPHVHEAMWLGKIHHEPPGDRGKRA